MNIWVWMFLSADSLILFNKFIMRLSTRARAILIALTITWVFIALRGVNFVELLEIDFPFDFIKLFIISILMYVGSFWVLNYRVKGERFFTVLLFPSLAIFILLLYIELIINSIFGTVGRFVTEVFASILVMTVSYVLILTTNILNIGYLEKIPLTQAGRAAHYVLTLISTYLFFSIIFSNSLPAIIKFIAVGVISYLFTSMALWTIDLRFNQRLLSSLGITLMMVLASFVLLIWPIGSEYLSLILSLFYYMSLGMALEVREVLNKRIWIEYSFLYIVIVTILLLISNWGINGRLV